MKIVKFIGTLYGWLLVIALLVLVVAFICMLIGSRCRKNDDARRKQDSKSKVQPKLRKDAPQPTSDQQRLHEIEESIFWSTGAIQANPMSRGATALSEEIQHLEREKMDLLKKIADNMDQITVQKAWNTFLPEQQEKFQERIYQYQQDVNRGGTEPEIAAANRGLMIVDGSPVPEEVANRLKTIEPTPGRPDGNIEVLKHLSTTENREDVAFDFEKTLAKRDVVKGGNQIYLRVTNYQCYAEANGRPVYTLTEDYHLTDASMIPLLTAESGLKFAIKSAAYRYEERGTGVLF